MKHFVIATAGHVDHGKSSLVKALTGTDPDRLPEEKARQITIDLGFAELNLGNDIHAAIVDVPGHEDFVRNMIAGVGSIDLALLVVAADDGWMPQTEEHLQILEYLGVQQAVIALTKIDIGDVGQVEAQIREQLSETKFAGSPIIPISVRNETGIEELRRALGSELAKMEPQRDIEKPRLFVDRAFTLHGIGTVVTGTLTGGTLRVGDEIVVQPRNLLSRIRSIQNHGRHVDLALPGMRTAINLPDVTPGRDIARGHVVTVAGLEPSKTIDVLLHRSDRLGRVPAIKSGAGAYLHHGTSRVRAKILLREDRHLAAGETASAQLRLSAPLLAFLGDRFVIRDASERHTLAGGVVLNPDAVAPDFRKRIAIDACEDVDLNVATDISRRGSARVSNLLRKSRFSDAEIHGALQRLEQAARVFRNGDVAVMMERWRELRKRAVELIDREHRAHPEKKGMELADLRATLASEGSDVFDSLIIDLCRGDCIRVGSTIARRSHQAQLPPAFREIAITICAALSQKPFDPPTQKQSDPQTRAVIRHLIEQNEIVELGSDLFITTTAFAKMKKQIVDFISTNGKATVSQLRGEIGTSRRIIVPLLERLDRNGVTRRLGDTRELRVKIVANCTLK